jgi:hypothetical protein
VVGEKEGSILLLESFLKEKVKDFDQEIISNFRDIMVLRSKRFPIHITDPKFVEVVIKLINKYPPNWIDLWIKSLEMYEQSLNKLLKCLQKSNSLVYHK